MTIATIPAFTPGLLASINGGIMAIIVLFLFIWLLRKACKALSRPTKHKAYSSLSKAKTDIQANLTALDALQQQRQQIEKTIAYIQESITTAETPEKTIQYMDRLSGLYGKLATVENKINKLMN